MYDDYPNVIYYYYFPFTKTSYSFAPREDWGVSARTRLSSPSTILRLARCDRPHPEFHQPICSCPFAAAAHHNKRFLFFVPLLHYAPPPLLPQPPPPPPPPSSIYYHLDFTTTTTTTTTRYSGYYHRSRLERFHPDTSKNSVIVGSRDSCDIVVIGDRFLIVVQ